jgi:hypothetical protein
VQEAAGHRLGLLQRRGGGDPGRQVEPHGEIGVVGPQHALVDLHLLP